MRGNSAKMRMSGNTLGHKRGVSQREFKGDHRAAKGTVPLNSYSTLAIDKRDIEELRNLTSREEIARLSACHYIRVTFTENLPLAAMFSASSLQEKNP